MPSKRCFRNGASVMGLMMSSPKRQSLAGLVPWVDRALPCWDWFVADIALQYSRGFRNGAYDVKPKTAKLGRSRAVGRPSASMLGLVCS